VTTDTGGTRELVEDGMNGCIIRMRDAEHIAEKLSFLASHPKETEVYGKESRRRAEALGWNEVAKEYRKEYRDTMNNFQ
jgi:glycosyltransferase involved in cell wall biosynthesis